MNKIISLILISFLSFSGRLYASNLEQGADLSKNNDCIASFKKSENLSEITSKSGKRIMTVYDNFKRPKKIDVNGEVYEVLYSNAASTEFIGLQSETTGKIFDRPMRRVGTPTSPTALSAQAVWQRNTIKLKCDNYSVERTSDDKLQTRLGRVGGKVALTEGDGDHEPPGWAHDMPDIYEAQSYWEPVIENDYFADTYAFIQNERERLRQCITRVDVCTGKCDTSGDYAEYGCDAFALIFIEVPWFAGSVALACHGASKQIRAECKSYCGSISQCL